MKLKFYLFTLVLLFQLMSYGQTFNADGINYNITSVSDPLTVEVGQNFMMMSKTVMIPETVIYDSNTYEVTAIGEAAFFDSLDLTSVLIPDSVTSIGTAAFAMCHSLTSVTIPNSVISIGELAFDHCTSLQTVNIGNSVTSIAPRAFGMCHSLTTVICNSTTPLVINPSVFDNDFGPSVNRTLYVPYSAVAAYQNTAVWQDFNPILPIDVSATHLNLDGVDDYIDCGNILTESYTKEAWIYLNEFAAENNIVSGSDNFGQHALWVPNGILSAGHNGQWNAVEDSNILELNTWYHVAVSYDSPSQTLKLYKDGSLVATNTNVLPSVNGNEVNIGSYNDANYLFNGSIDEVRIWNVVRTVEELNESKNVELQNDETGLIAYYNFNQGLDSQDNTQETVLFDSSENITHGTLHNFELLGSTSNWLAGSPISTPATYLNFGNSHDFIDCGDDVSLRITGNTITLEAYVKFNSFASQAYLGNIINKDDANGPFNSGYMLRAGGNGVVNFALGNSGWNETNSPENSISLNTWHHIAGVYDGTTAKIYVDGIEVASQDFTMNIGNAYRNLNIGKDPQFNDRFLDAAIDDVRIWNIARTANQINKSKNCELQGVEEGLVAYYKFNHGLNADYNSSELQLVDATGNGNDGILNSFTLFGTTSNWLKGSPLTSGVVIPTAPAVDTQTFCGSATVTDLEIIGSTLKWYNSETSDTALIAITDLETGTYYVSDFNANGCESERTMVNVTISDIPEVPTITALVTYSQGDDASALTATSGGLDLAWYETETGGISDSEAPTPSTETIGSTSYWVANVSDDGCYSERVEIVVTVEEVLGVGDRNILNAIKVYPNPTDGQVSIMLPSTNEVKITVYDLNGRLLLSKVNTSDNFIINLEQYEAGVYVLKIKIDENETIKRIVKK
ncbi:putative secreted protein (Por secretion system target) [Winogradskyella pacifica]|uniref:Putative secreted protein (Por secretion system target) n=1 Tax=Winogradskyella pacifica TaxID=664642 RepID=A0A3D9N2W0_9FLAO|nr:LamG-like jellyroll fold domain-containing protein [Winogradskyella pacifica]REE25152.1 putative secreted protein (Por secretion system target) [Winogradskyella pacifica]